MLWRRITIVKTYSLWKEAEVGLHNLRLRPIVTNSLAINLFHSNKKEYRNYTYESTAYRSFYENYSHYVLYCSVLIGSGFFFYKDFVTSFVHQIAKSTKGTAKFALCEDEQTQKLEFDSKSAVISKNEVAKHTTRENGIWVTYGDGVYDITKFVDLHPGGEIILLAAGGSLEPFWNLYAVHKTPEVYEMLEEMRIGKLDTKDVVAITKEDLEDPYANDPIRHPALRPVSIKPFNAETAPALAVQSFQTPSELFFVRNHLPVPKVDLEKYNLEIDGKGNPTGRSLHLKLDDLKNRFPLVSFNAALQCAGNRRNEMNHIKKVKGLEWGFTAISNAEWRGVRLRDVLISSGWLPEKLAELGIRHVHFEGLDVDPTGQHYGASIPIEKAMDPSGDVILAFEMNGQELSADHGYPLRVVAPGIVGARNVKWLSKIYLSDAESPSHWQQNDYKCFSPATDWDTVDFKKAPAIQDAPVQSAICVPANNAKLQSGSKEVTVRGYAWSGGGRGIVRVDVSSDGGKTWHVADMEQDSKQTVDKMWAWTVWTATVPLSTTDSNVEIVCKAIDRAYNNQPENVEGVWNLRGCLNNSWHRIVVHF